MITLYESILSSTKTGKTAFLIPKDKNELIDMISNEIMKNGLKCDLNHIKTHKITDMSNLFGDSWFNGDISNWDVSNVKNMKSMFAFSDFNGDISKWNVRKVENMEMMFERNSYFNNDISNWKINSKCDTRNMFYRCKIKDEYKPKQNGKIIE